MIPVDSTWPALHRPRCPICENEASQQFDARDALMGGDKTFSYAQCTQCKCLFILQAPENLPDHYSEQYYSFEVLSRQSDVAWIRRLKANRTEAALGSQNPLGWLLGKIKPAAPMYKTLKKAAISTKSAVLEIGCGAGGLLYDMRRDGFDDLTGIDPYLPVTLERADAGFALSRCGIEEFSAGFDRKFELIMMHHTIEHMDDHKRRLLILRDMLISTGFLWITTPIVGYAWRKYGINWVGLEAPRHLIVHSENSMLCLCRELGLDIVDYHHNSTEFAFIASEQNARGIRLRDPNSYIMNPSQSIFSSAQLAEYRALAHSLNDARDGDSASFLLRPV